MKADHGDLFISDDDYKRYYASSYHLIIVMITAVLNSNYVGSAS